MDDNTLADLTRRLDFKAHATGNPISDEEARKINSYIDRVVKKQDFSPEQASEFRTLIERYASDEQIKKSVGRDRLDALLGIAGSIFARYYLQINPSK